jgi:hypothetical protein
METLKTLRDKVLRQLDEAGSTTSSAIVDDAINQAHAERLTSQNWPFLLHPQPQTITLAADRKTYALHPDFGRAYYFRNTTRNQWLVEIPLRNIEEASQNWTDEAGGQMFGLFGRSPVARQPTSSSPITLTSSSGSDTGSAFAVEIVGTTGNGVLGETLTPSGTSEVTSANSYSDILSVTLTATWTGTLTLTSNSGAVTNLVLLPGEYGRSYQQFTTLFTPTDGDVVEYRFFRLPKELVNDYDLPLIPYPFSKILVWDALLIFATYDNQLTNARAAEWRTRVASIEASMQTAFLDAQSVQARPRLVRFIEDI